MAGASAETAKPCALTQSRTAGPPPDRTVMSRASTVVSNSTSAGAGAAKAAAGAGGGGRVSPGPPSKRWSPRAARGAGDITLGRGGHTAARPGRHLALVLPGDPRRLRHRSDRPGVLPGGGARPARAFPPHV